MAGGFFSPTIFKFLLGIDLFFPIKTSAPRLENHAHFLPEVKTPGYNHVTLPKSLRSSGLSILGHAVNSFEYLIPKSFRRKLPILKERAGGEVKESLSRAAQRIGSRGDNSTLRLRSG